MSEIQGPATDSQRLCRLFQVLPCKSTGRLCPKFLGQFFAVEIQASLQYDNRNAESSHDEHYHYFDRHRRAARLVRLQRETTFLKPRRFEPRKRKRKDARSRSSSSWTET